MKLDKDYYLRAGYSANAEMDLESKDSVLAIREALLQYNRITEKPFVEILEGDNKFKKEDVELGISDGINVEIKEGVNEGDKIEEDILMEPVICHGVFLRGSD